MANLLQDSGQVLITYHSVKESHPTWSDVAIQDYIAQKQDILTISAISSDTEAQVEANRLAIIVNAENIEDNSQAIAANAGGIADNALAIANLVLDALGDVTVLTPVDGQSLVYDSGQWINLDYFLKLTGGTLTGALSVDGVFDTTGTGIEVTGTSVGSADATLDTEYARLGQVKTLADAFNVVEADVAYQVLVTDDQISCDGTFTVTLPDIADAYKAVGVSSTTGTITIAGDATINGGTSLISGTESVWFPARGEWWLR